MTIIFLMLLLGASEPADAALLRPAPSLTGRVVDRAGQPIANARLTAAGVVLARTDAKGRFAFALPATAPETFAIEAPSYATRAVALPRNPASFALGDLVLLRAASVTVDVSKVRGVRELSLVRYEHRRDDAHAITKRVTGRVTTFTGLDKGNYLLTARGREPLQLKSQLIEVGESATERIILTVDRMKVRGYVFLGREPLAGASVEITGPASAWRGIVQSDADGRYEAELWQVGAMQAVVTSPRLASEFAAGHRGTEALERGVIEWDLIVPDRRIVGRIVDDTGAPVVRASIALESEDGEIRARLNAATDANGRFEYGAARSGRYRLDIDSAQHLKPPPIRFELRDDDPDERVDVVLQRGLALTVRVVAEDGKPIAGATIADGLVEDGSRPMARYRTAIDGRVVIRGRENEEKTLYVIPPQGSFTVVRATLDADTLQRGVDVTVPDASSALVIRAKDEHGAALDGIKFMVRYNGELLPPAILTLIRFVQHVEYRTSTTGEARIHGLPAGLYELWAYRTAGEGERLMRNPQAYEPSLELAVAVGTYEADLTFGQ